MKKTSKAELKSRAIPTSLRRMLIQRARTVPFPNHLGMKLHRLSYGDVEFVMPLRDQLTQYQGIVHGGALASLADTAATFAALTVLPEDMDLVTVEFKINFLAGLDRGNVYARGTVVRSGRRVSVAEVRMHGPTRRRLLATGTFTMLNFAL